MDESLDDEGLPSFVTGISADVGPYDTPTLDELDGIAGQAGLYGFCVGGCGGHVSCDSNVLDRWDRNVRTFL